MEANEDLLTACRVIKSGKVLLYPTDTVWGIGCDATDGDAVRRVYGIKRRPDSKAMLLLMDSIATVRRYFPALSDAAERLLLDERPTTVILSGSCGIAPELMAPDGTVGVRVTREPYSRELCRKAGVPVVSTSANISGEPAARMFGEISDEITNAVDYVCVSRRDDPVPGVPSRIVKLNNDGTITILRP